MNCGQKGTERLTVMDSHSAGRTVRFALEVVLTFVFSKGIAESRFSCSRGKEDYIMQKETAPSQSEWLIMEVFWASGASSLTAKEVIRKVQEKTDMSSRMVRVLLNRLWQKGVLSYTTDKKDARIYHYRAVKSKEECQKEKSRKFTDSYFEGSSTNAVAALLQSTKLTKEQFEELEEILKTCRDMDKS